MKDEKKDKTYDFVIELTKIKEMAVKHEIEVKKETDNAAEYLKQLENIEKQSTELRKSIEVYEQKYLG